MVIAITAVSAAQSQKAVSTCFKSKADTVSWLRRAPYLSVQSVI